MAFEAISNLAWVLIISLAVVAVMIGFFLFMRPEVAGGWLTDLVSSVKWFIEPVV